MPPVKDNIVVAGAILLIHELKPVKSLLADCDSFFGMAFSKKFSRRAKHFYIYNNNRKSIDKVLIECIPSYEALAFIWSHLDYRILNPCDIPDFA